MPPPPGPCRGSGKPDTPLARMHRDIAAGELAGPHGLDGPVGLELELQPAITTAQPTAAIAIDHLRWPFSSVPDVTRSLAGTGTVVPEIA